MNESLPGIAGNMSTWSFSYRGTSDISGFSIDFSLLIIFINKENQVSNRGRFIKGGRLQEVSSDLT